MESVYRMICQMLKNDFQISLADAFYSQVTTPMWEKLDWYDDIATENLFNLRIELEEI